MPIKCGDGLTSPLILSLVVTWISVISTFFQTFFYFLSALSGILEVLPGRKSVESVYLSKFLALFFETSFLFLELV